MILMRIPRVRRTGFPRMAYSRRTDRLSAEADNPVEGVSDEELLRLHRTGQKGAFEVLMRRYSGELYRFLVRFLRDRTLAEDVFQDTFLQVHLAAEGFDTRRRFKPWLFTIAANKARDAMRSRGRRRAVPLDAQMNAGEDQETTFLDLLAAETELPGEQMENREVRQAVQEVVMGMPESLRDVLLLSYFHQFSYKDVAEILGVPLGTVKSRLHSAVGQFAQRWESKRKRF